MRSLRYTKKLKSRAVSVLVLVLAVMEKEVDEVKLGMRRCMKLWLWR